MPLNRRSNKLLRHGRITDPTTSNIRLLLKFSVFSGLVSQLVHHLHADSWGAWNQERVPHAVSLPREPSRCHGSATAHHVCHFWRRIVSCSRYTQLAVLKIWIPPCVLTSSKPRLKPRKTLLGNSRILMDSCLSGWASKFSQTSSKSSAYNYYSWCILVFCLIRPWRILKPRQRGLEKTYCQTPSRFQLESWWSHNYHIGIRT